MVRPATVGRDGLKGDPSDAQAREYELLSICVPQDLVVRHRKGEPTIVTLELREGKVLLTGLK